MRQVLVYDCEVIEWRESYGNLRLHVLSALGHPSPRSAWLPMDGGVELTVHAVGAEES